MAEARMAYARAANSAGTAARTYAGSTLAPMPGTFRWIMNGMTLIAAPTMAQTPVATRPSTLISRASVPPAWGELGGAFIQREACDSTERSQPGQPEPRPI